MDERMDDQGFDERDRLRYLSLVSAKRREESKKEART
jgi:hypothetical protein